MTKAATVRAIYKCLLRDARDLQQTPQFRLRNALRLEQWGTGHFVESPAHERDSTDADAQAPPSLRVADIRSLGQYLTLEERGFAYEPEQSTDLVHVIRESFRESAGLTSPQVRLHVLPATDHHACIAHCYCNCIVYHGCMR